MGCCDCGGETKKKRRVPIAVWVLLVLILLALFFWQ